MTAVLGRQIEIDDRGTAWIVDANTRVQDVALDTIAHGWSPEEIHFQHPELSLAQIHAALAYYYENQSSLDRAIRRDLEETDRLAEVAQPGAFQVASLRRRVR